MSEVPPHTDIDDEHTTAVAAEARMRAIVEAAVDGIITIDHNGLVESFNPAAEQIFGYPACEVLGHNVKMLMPEPYRSDHDQHMTNYLESRAGKVIGIGREVAGRRKDGTVFPMEIAVSELMIEGQHKFTGIVRDVTERKRVQKSLVESERRLRAVLEAAVDAIITINESGVIESTNAAAEGIFEYTSEEMIGNNVSMLMPEPYRSEHDGYIARFVRTGERKIIGIGREVEGQRKDGTTFPMDLAVSEVHLEGRRMFTGIARDITDRKLAEAAVGESERKLSTLISNLPGAAYRCRNDRSWTMEFISGGCRDLCGYAASDIIAGSPRWVDLIHEDDRESVGGQVQSNVSERQAFQVVYRIWHRNGELRWVWEQGRGVYSADGGLLALEGLMTDMTELQRAREQLVQSERLAAMGQMLSGIAHESRNALQRIQVGVDMLEFEIDEESESKRDLVRIARAREDLHRLFEELRNYAAPVKLDLSERSLSGIWRQAWSSLETARSGRDAELLEETSGANFVCQVDGFRIEQVFRNIFENALAACSDPVRITINGCDAELDGVPAVRLSVRDNGAGLVAEQQNRVFDAFYTTKAKGSGLGMAIAKRIIEAHRGTIAVGEANQGAEFVITIPRTSSDPAGTAP